MEDGFVVPSAHRSSSFWHSWGTWTYWDSFSNTLPLLTMCISCEVLVVSTQVQPKVTNATMMIAYWPDGGFPFAVSASVIILYDFGTSCLRVKQAYDDSLSRQLLPLVKRYAPITRS